MSDLISREAAVAELSHRKDLLHSQLEALDIRREDSTYQICIDAIRALPAAPASTVKGAAAAMKAAWDADFAQRDLVLAACFAGAAHEAALTSPLTADDAPAALLRAFLTALIDPMSADLDYLRADPTSGEAARSAAPEATA